MHASVIIDPQDILYAIIPAAGLWPGRHWGYYHPTQGHANRFLK
jgi:hypothetical protein